MVACFNPRRPRGRRHGVEHRRLILGVSIHAAREGGDIGALRQWTVPSRFQSTPPARAATACPQLTERQALLDPVPRTALATPPLRRRHQVEIP